METTKKIGGFKKGAIMLFFAAILLFLWRTISVTTYEGGFHVNIYNQTGDVVPYIALGSLDPLHEFTDIKPSETVKTHVASMEGERVIVFVGDGETILAEEAIMSVMSATTDVHFMNIYVTQGEQNGEKKVRVESLDGSLILPWWIRQLYAYETVEMTVAMAEQKAGVDVLELASLPETTRAMDMRPYELALNAMSNEAFDQAIAEMLQQTKDVAILGERLLACGVVLSQVSSQSPPQEGTLNPSLCTMSVYTVKRACDSFYRLNARLAFAMEEKHPATLDGLSLYYDMGAVGYYDYNRGANGFRLAAGINATKGCVVFTFDDSIVTTTGYDDVFVATVYVEPKVGVEADIGYGAKYGHTYGAKEVQLSEQSVEASFAPVHE